MSNSSRAYPHPASDIVSRLAAFQHDDSGFWRTDVVIQQIDATTTRLGVRQVPRWGLTYHLVLLRLQLEQRSEHETRVKGRLRIEPWVWFATLPLFLLVLYSLGVMATGDLEISPYTVAVNAALLAYVVFMVWLTLRHIRQLRAMLQAALGAGGAEGT